MVFKPEFACNQVYDLGGDLRPSAEATEFVSNAFFAQNMAEAGEPENWRVIPMAERDKVIEKDHLLVAQGLPPKVVVCQPASSAIPMKDIRILVVTTNSQSAYQLKLISLEDYLENKDHYDSEKMKYCKSDPSFAALAAASPSPANAQLPKTASFTPINAPGFNLSHGVTPPSQTPHSEASGPGW